MNIDDPVAVLRDHLLRNYNEKSCQHHQIHLIAVKLRQKRFIECLTALIILRGNAKRLNAVPFRTLQRIRPWIVADHNVYPGVRDSALIDGV